VTQCNDIIYLYLIYYGIIIVVVEWRMTAAAVYTYRYGATDGGNGDTGRYNITYIDAPVIIIIIIIIIYRH